MKATNEQINKSIINATKWSTISEVCAKLVTPITNMILARLIAPEAFGIIATVNMIMSFADMFTDAGFQKYLIQHEFKNDEEKYESANVAFITNLSISILLWMIIIIFRNKISSMVGNPGHGKVISIACFQLILTSFSSIQMALYRRNFDFKTLFIVRIVYVLIPFVITVPLAFLGYSYWALIIGNIFMELSNAIILTIKSDWKPKLYYNFNLLKKMLSFSSWTLLESISIWFASWIDIFIISNALTQYDLGLYKTSTTMVNSLMALITASVVPVLFSALSRVQNDNFEFKKIYYNTQKITAILIFPIGLGLFLYRDLATQIMLGKGWEEAANIIGVWGLVSSVMIIFNNFSGEVYRAKGKPKLSFIAQVLHLVVLVPTCLIAAKYGFWTLIYSRALIRLQLLLIQLIIMQFYIKISIKETLINIFPIILSTLGMGGIILIIKPLSDSMIWNIGSIIIAMVSYFVILNSFKSMKGEIHKIVKNFIKK